VHSFRNFEPLLFLIFTAGLVGFVFRMAVTQARKATANLQALAQRLGLVYREDKIASFVTTRTVTGPQAGREVSFHSFTTGSGKSSTTWRAVSVRPRQTDGLTFYFHRQGLASKIEALFGAKEAVVGDAVFDAAWFLQTNEPEFLGAALVPEVRAKLMAAQAAGGANGNFKLVNGTVRYAEVGTFADPRACTRLEQMLPVLHDLADITEVAAEQEPPATRT
jgi:hypothetical protein